jgi:hypothetical protein
VFETGLAQALLQRPVDRDPHFARAIAAVRSAGVPNAPNREAAEPVDPSVVPIGRQLDKAVGVVLDTLHGVSRHAAPAEHGEDRDPVRAVGEGIGPELGEAVRLQARLIVTRGIAPFGAQGRGWLLRGCSRVLQRPDLVMPQLRLVMVAEVVNPATSTHRRGSDMRKRGARGIGWKPAREYRYPDTHGLLAQ